MSTKTCWLLSDAALCRRLLNFLFTQSQLHSCELEIRVFNGEAIVSGCVASWQQERILTGCCQRVAGIREVVSHITVLETDRGLSRKMTSTRIEHGTRIEHDCENQFVRRS